MDVSRHVSLCRVCLLLHNVDVVCLSNSAFQYSYFCVSCYLVFIKSDSNIWISMGNEIRVCDSDGTLDGVFLF